MFRYLIPIAWLFSVLGKKALKKATVTDTILKIERPEEYKHTKRGLLIGGLIGAFIGGSIGIAGFFGAVGVSLIVVGGILGAFIGNRLGIEIDKKNIKRKQR